jgi:hypothetical protein
MGIGVSTSSASSKQDAISSLTQQYSGTCDISCDNDISNVDITIIRSKFGDITLSQTCSANGSCLMSNNTNAVSDVFFKAQNTSAANDPLIFSWADPSVQVDVAKTHDVQNIQQNINEAVNQSCKVTSTNQINNVNIFAEDSYGGNIDIAQQGEVGGQCQMENYMSAAAYATGTADNCSAAGKFGGKKCAAGKGNKTIIHFVIGAAVVFIFIVIAVLVLRMLSRRGETAVQTKPTRAKVAPTPPPATLGNQPEQTFEIKIVPVSKPSTPTAPRAATPTLGGPIEAPSSVPAVTVAKSS